MSKNQTEIILIENKEGSSIAEAIKISGAKNFNNGFDAQFEYLESVCNYKDIIKFSYDILFFWDRVINKISVSTLTGWSPDYFFDITDVYNAIEGDDCYSLKNLKGIVN